VTSFLEIYGLGASLGEQHGGLHPFSSASFCTPTFYLEWLGSVGAILGFWCGMALVWSPLGVFYFSLSREVETFRKV
jgi:hypothetical protein